jgi:hypothetical protein
MRLQCMRRFVKEDQRWGVRSLRWTVLLLAFNFILTVATVVLAGIRAAWMEENEDMEKFQVSVSPPAPPK